MGGERGQTSSPYHVGQTELARGRALPYHWPAGGQGARLNAGLDHRDRRARRAAAARAPRRGGAVLAASAAPAGR
eukprot:4843077-Prymnesium_polylepis.1